MANVDCEARPVADHSLIVEPDEGLKSEIDDWARGAVSSPCPDCGTQGSVVRSGWCVTCMDCGWSPCSRR